MHFDECLSHTGTRRIRCRQGSNGHVPDGERSRPGCDPGLARERATRIDTGGPSCRLGCRTRAARCWAGQAGECQENTRGPPEETRSLMRRVIRAPEAKADIAPALEYLDRYSPAA